MPQNILPFSILMATVVALFLFPMPNASALTTCPNAPSPSGLPRTSLFLVNSHSLSSGISYSDTAVNSELSRFLAPSILTWGTRGAVEPWKKRIPKFNHVSFFSFREITNRETDAFRILLICVIGFQNTVSAERHFPASVFVHSRRNSIFHIKNRLGHFYL